MKIISFGLKGYLAINVHYPDDNKVVVHIIKTASEHKRIYVNAKHYQKLISYTNTACLLKFAEENQI